jgi:uncharacterized membrane protein YidH (DUF202 family)
MIVMNKSNSEIYRMINLLLAEKRTSLAVLRTGIAIFTLPLSVFTILIATSRYYELSTSLHFVVPLLIICFLLVILGIYLIYRSFKKIKSVDRKIQEIKKDQISMSDILDTC